VEFKKLAATTAMAGALGFAAFSVASGAAHADPKWPAPNPPGPGHGDIWVPGDPPGHNPFGPPGQVKQQPLVNGVPNPLYNVPPGHWNDPAYVGLPINWIPPIELLPAGIPGVTGPLPLVFNPAVPAWGVWVNDNVFVPYPV
jgi:hypothetical protein